MLKRLLAVLTAMLLTLATFAYAAELREDHPTSYTVVKGDTLWDISARFLTKPWLWPEIWQANPQVKNPHLIYPGDTLSLVYINGQPRISLDPGPQPQIRYGEPIETIPLSEIEVWLKQLTVVQDPKPFPYVVGLEGDHLTASGGEVAFVRGMTNAQPGQEVQLARPTAYFAMGPMRNGRRLGGQTILDVQGDRDHLHWGYGDSAPREATGEKLGYQMRFSAFGKVTQVTGDIATVVLFKNDAEVKIGDRVLPVEAQPYCNCFTPHPSATIPADAQLLAVDRSLAFAGTRMVVALSVGSRDGVDNGTVFSVWNPGESRKDLVKYNDTTVAATNKVTLPDRYMGHVMVFRTFDRVSYALVTDSLRQLEVGDYLRHPDADR